MYLDIRDLRKSFGQGESRTEVLKGISFGVEKGKICVLLGPSGSGKSTLLNIIGGIETPDSGFVSINGEPMKSMKEKELSSYRRIHLGYVFQSYNLISNLTVKENIETGAYLSEKPLDVDEILHILGLWEHRDKVPNQLSGGQQQRIAIARAIVNEPRVLLLDEPLGALDLKMRQEMQYELIRLKHELGITFLYVTHDQEEALTMSDKVVVMNQGYIQQMGTPEEIYNEPENAFVADFIGDSNIIDGVMMEDRIVKICDHIFPCIDEGFGRKKPVDVVIRPEDIIIGKPGSGIMDGVVTSNVFIGVHYEMCIEAGGFEWLAQNTVSYPEGTKVSIDVLPENIQIMHKPQSEDEQAIALDDFE